MMIGKQKETSCYKYVYYRGLLNTYELAFYKLVINKSSEHKEIVKYLSEFFSNWNNKILYSMFFLVR